MYNAVHKYWSWYRVDIVHKLMINVLYMNIFHEEKNMSSMKQCNYYSTEYVYIIMTFIS